MTLNVTHEHNHTTTRTRSSLSSDVHRCQHFLSGGSRPTPVLGDYLVGLAPDGGAALELRGPGGDVLGGEGQVVVGGLHRQRGPGRPGLPDQSQRLGRGQVNDVTPDPGGSEGGDVKGTLGFEPREEEPNP